jgi:hypothetical protein
MGRFSIDSPEAFAEFEKNLAEEAEKYPGAADGVEPYKKERRPYPKNRRKPGELLKQKQKHKTMAEYQWKRGSAPYRAARDRILAIYVAQIKSYREWAIRLNKKDPTSEKAVLVNWQYNRLRQLYGETKEYFKPKRGKGQHQNSPYEIPEYLNPLSEKFFKNLVPEADETPAPDHDDHRGDG